MEVVQTPVEFEIEEVDMAGVPAKAKKNKTVPVNPDTGIVVISKAGCLLLEGTPEGVKRVGFIQEKDFMEALRGTMPISTGIIDKNTIYYESMQVGSVTRHLVGCEYDPHMRKISQNGGDGPEEEDEDHDWDKSEIFNLPMPYIQFYNLFEEKSPGKFTILDTRITCSTKQIVEMNDKISQIPLCNVYDNGCICWGRANAFPPGTNMLPSAYCKRIFDHFFDSHFNWDIDPIWPAKSPQSFEDWQAMSLETVLHVNFHPLAAKTFGELLDTMRKVTDAR